MKRLLIILCLFISISCMNSYAQVVGKIGFYETEEGGTRSAMVQNKGNIDNAKWCHITRGGKEYKLLPSEVTRYGLEGGRVYYSKEVIINGVSKIVFLEIISIGSVNLYYYRSEGGVTYFLERESVELLAIPKTLTSGSIKTTYNDLLLEYLSDYPAVAEYVKFVSYNRESLRKFINEYNNRSIENFDRVKISVQGSYTVTKLLPKAHPGINLVEHLEYDPEINIAFALGVSLPLPRENFSLYAELQYYRFKYFGHGTSLSGYLYNYGEVKQLILPLLIRYDLHLNPATVHFAGGGIFGYNKSTNTLYRAEMDQNIAQIYWVNSDPFLTPVQFGLSLETGAEIPVFKRFSISAGIRYNYLFSPSSTFDIDQNSFQILTGINF